MPKYRFKCPNCGTVQDLLATGPCKKCGNILAIEQPGLIALYRMGNFMGAGGAFGLYLNNVPFGKIGNRETILFPLPYGQYLLHIAAGMNRRCNDPIINITPQDPYVCLKVHMNVGFVSNSFIIERVDPSTMPSA